MIIPGLGWIIDEIVAEQNCVCRSQSGPQVRIKPGCMAPQNSFPLRTFGSAEAGKASLPCFRFNRVNGDPFTQADAGDKTCRVAELYAGRGGDVATDIIGNLLEDDSAVKILVFVQMFKKARHVVQAVGNHVLRFFDRDCVSPGFVSGVNSDENIHVN